MGIAQLTEGPGSVFPVVFSANTTVILGEGQDWCHKCFYKLTTSRLH